MTSRSIWLLLVAEASTELQRILDVLQAISTSLMAIAWIAVGIGWFSGWLKIALPIPSRRLKASGREEVESAGIAAFAIAIFSTLLALIVWIVRMMGVPAPPSLP